MKLKYLFFLMFVTIVVQAQEKLQLSLDDCIKIGLEKSKAIKISKAKVDASNYKVKETNAATLPSLKMTAGYTKLSDVGAPNFGQAGAALSSAFKPILDNYNMRLTLSQPLFTGNRLSGNVDVAEYNQKATEEDFNKDLSQTVLDLKTAYWNYFRSIELNKVVEENINQVKAHLTDIENYMQQGLATNNDVLKVKVQLSNVRLLKIDAENEMEKNRLSLNSIMGIPLGSVVELKETAKYNSAGMEPLENIVQEAIVTRPELKGMELRIKSGEAAVSMAQGGWFPQVSFNANYTYANPNSRIFPSKAEFNGTWDVGVNLSFDIWNWLTTSHQTGQAQAQLDQSQFTLAQLKDAVVLEVTQNYLGLKKANEKILLAQETVTQADENLNIMNQKFKNGMILNSELIDAEVALLQAKTNYTSAIADYEIAKAKLLRAVGKQ